MGNYYRPLVQTGLARPVDAVRLAGGWCWFNQVEVISRKRKSRIVHASSIPQAVFTRLIAERKPVAGLSFDQPRVMGILNATPDSFSDGGRHILVQDATATGLAMQQAGVDIIDVGGESTRPGAQSITAQQELRRVEPVILGLRLAGVTCAISIDTRKAAVAEVAAEAGADLVNDVSGLTFDPALAPFCAAQGMPVCVMHAQGDPATMQDKPRYDNVLLDVYDFLEGQIKKLRQQGIPRQQIIADPGIGFGKTQAHNLALLSRISLFHSLGVPILLGASRKRFIGAIGGVSEPDQRGPGSVGVALAALGQGIQMLRVHDVAETIQAAALWRAAAAGEQA